MLQRFVWVCCFLALGLSAALKAQNAYHENKIVVRIKPNFRMPQPNERSSATAKALALAGAKQWRAAMPAMATARMNAKQRQSQQKHRMHELFTIELDASMPAAMAQQMLSRESWVEYAEPLYKHDLFHTPNDPLAANQWGLAESFGNLYNAWDVTKGDTSNVIAIIDTGCQPNHPGLAANWKYNRAERYGTNGIDDDGNGYIDDSLGYDFGFRDATVADGQGHGTLVAGMAGATANDGYGTVGTAYNCRLMPIKIMGKTGGLDNEYEAVMYAAANGARILNLSWGRSGNPSRYEQEVIDYVIDTYDVLIFAAAGNTNAQLDYYPASYKRVFSVAHSSYDNQASGSTTYSYFVDMMAPGISVLTTSLGNGHRYVQGSSFASPFAAGVAALVMARYPELRPQQVGELMRVSADDLYSLPFNAARMERLGKGRVDAYRAVTELGQQPSVRLWESAYTNTNRRLGLYFRPGDTLSVTVDLVNYLKATTGNAKAVLSSPSPYVSILQGNFDFGALGSLDSASNAQAPFLVYIHPDYPKNTRLAFRLGISDSGYSDYDYFYITPNTQTIPIGFNYFGASLYPNGRFGFSDGTGYGMEYRGKQILKEMGFLAATAPNKVSDGLWQQGTTYSDDLTPQERLYFDNYDTVGIVSNTFNDYALNPNGIGIDVKQRVMGWNHSLAHYNYLIVEYNISHQRQRPIDTLYTGLYADWNFLSDSTAHADWDAQGKFAYVRSDNGEYLGIWPIHPNHTYLPLDKKAPTNGVYWADGFSEEEKYRTLAWGSGQSAAGGANGSDVAHILGRRIVNMPADTTMQAVYVVLGGSSLEDLRTAAQNSTFFIDKIYRHPKPVLNNMSFCPGDGVVLRPEADGHYRFFRDASLTQMMGEGRSYAVPPQHLKDSIYIVRTGKLLDSYALAVPLSKKLIPGLIGKGQHKLSDRCFDGKWTYFRTAPGQPFAFAIEEDPAKKGRNQLNGLTVEISVAEKSSTVGFFRSMESTTTGFANFVMGRYWNIELGANDKLIDPINIRFFYDKKELDVIMKAAATWANKDTISAIGSPVWFKQRGNFNPEMQLIDTGLLGAFDLLEPSDFGQENGVDYVQFNGISSLAGGSAMVPVVGLFLPVELVGFEAVLEDDGAVRLNWATAQEQGAKQFNIERSADGFNFTHIGSTPAYGKSQEWRNYAWTDREALPEKAYYRLKMLDADGTHSYSPVAFVDLSNWQPYMLAPNPVAQELRITAKNHAFSKGDWVVFNSLGQEGFRIQVDEGASSQSINLSQLPNGLYWLAFLPNGGGPSQMKPLRVMVAK